MRRDFGIAADYEGHDGMITTSERSQVGRVRCTRSRLGPVDKSRASASEGEINPSSSHVRCFDRNRNSKTIVIVIRLWPTFEHGCIRVMPNDQ
jgi:hypothetical protein